LRAHYLKLKKLQIPSLAVVITAGIPFGTSGSTNLLRIAKVIADKDLT
jgi:Pyruvate kinase